MNNKKFLKDMQSASSSIYSSAELFSYTKVSEFIQLIEKLSQNALNGEFDLSESFLDLLNGVPSILRAMISGEDNLIEDARQTSQKFSNILELLQHSVHMEDSTDLDRSAAPFAGQDSREQKKKYRPEPSTQEIPPDKDPDVSDVRRAIRYFDKLF